MKGGELSPERFALSAAVGLFVGAQPYYGAHIILCSLICIPLRLNSLIAYLVAWYSIPPLMPLLLYISLEIGHRIMTGEALALTWEHFAPSDLLNVTHELIIGAIGLGLGMSLLFTPPIYLFARTFKKKNRQELVIPQKVIFDIFELYRGQKKSDQYSALLQLKFNSLSENLMAHLQEKNRRSLRVLVIGCARGQHCFLLAKLGFAQQILGIESDSEHLKSAELALQNWQGSTQEAAGAAVIDCSFSKAAARESDHEGWDLILLVQKNIQVESAESRAFIQKYGRLLTPEGEMVLSSVPGGLGASLWDSLRASMPFLRKKAFRESSPWLVETTEQKQAHLLVTPRGEKGFVGLVTHAK